MPTLTIRDETTAGDTTGTLELTDLSERMTVRELIRERVYQEVRDLEVRQAAAVKTATERGGLDYSGLVAPSDAEQTLNGVRVPKTRKVDWKEQFESACQAFENSSILILIDDRQAESLDEQFKVSPSTDVAFLKLTPLVGG